MTQCYQNYSKKQQKEILLFNKYHCQCYLRTQATPNCIAVCKVSLTIHDAGIHYHIPPIMDEKTCLPESREML